MDVLTCNRCSVNRLFLIHSLSTFFRYRNLVLERYSDSHSSLLQWHLTNIPVLSEKWKIWNLSIVLSFKL